MQVNRKQGGKITIYTSKNRQDDEVPHLYDHTQVPTLAYPYDRFQSDGAVPGRP